jgi:uncharacterized protein
MKPLTLYFMLACAISWLVWLPLYAPAFGVHSLPVWPLQHGTGGLGPLLAAFFTSAVFYGKSGVRQMLNQCFRVRPLMLFLVALLLPSFLLVVGTWLFQLVSGQVPDWAGLWQSKEFPAWGIIPWFAYNLIFFGFGEEVGWRGLMLPQVQRKLPALTASIVVSLFWAIWHVPLFFYREGYMTMSAGGAAGWVLSLVTGSILLTWLYNSSRGSILICAIFHTNIDLAFTSKLSSPQVSGYIGIIITLWGIATVWVFGHRQLSRKPRITVADDNV